MKKMASIFLLSVIFMFYEYILINIASEFYKKRYVYPFSYVQSINTPYYGNDKIKGILQEFNSYGDNKIVFFNKTSTHERPITIVEQDDLDPFWMKVNGETTLGLTMVNYKNCPISLKTYMDYDKLRKVLIHEYMHCMGYEHVNDGQDLMNPYLPEGYIDNSIKAYAKDLEKKM